MHRACPINQLHQSTSALFCQNKTLSSRLIHYQYAQEISASMRPDGPRDPVAGPDSGPEPPFPIKISGPVIKGFGRGSKEVNALPFDYSGPIIRSSSSSSSSSSVHNLDSCQFHVKKVPPLLSCIGFPSRLHGSLSTRA